MATRTTRLLLLPPALGLVLLGAHFLRQGDVGLAAGFLVMVGMLFSRQAWVRLVAFVVLMGGAYVWAISGMQFINMRMALGLDYTRLGIIMAGVLCFDLLAAGTLVSPWSRRFFNKKNEQPRALAATFLLTCFGLGMARHKVSFPILLADRFFPGFGWLEIVLVGLYAVFVVNAMLDRKRSASMRAFIWSLFSVVFFGQLFLGLLGVEAMLMTGKLHLPVPALILAGPVYRGAGYFMLILLSVTLVLVGPGWCSHLCYIGAWDDRMSRFGPKPSHDPRISRWMVPGRALALLLTVGVAFSLRIAGVSWLAAVYGAAVFGIVGVGVMVVFSRRSGMMVHCTTFCPIGLVTNILGKVSPWRIRIGSDCTRCGACFTRCRYNALNEVQVEKGMPTISCTLCGDCVGTCAHNQIGYKFPGLDSNQARTVFIVLIISLHAIFLGVARI